MRPFVCIFFFSAVALVSSAQTALPPPSQELLPLENGITSAVLAYHAQLRTVLFENPPTGDPFASRALSEDEFQFLILPPFTPETLLTVSKRDENYVGVVISPDKQIWSFDGDTAALGVKRKEKHIPAPVAQRADRLWREMLIRTHFANSGSYPDATTYCFFKWLKGAGTLAGETRPKSNTRPALLVAIALGLIEYVAAEAALEASVLERLENLMTKLENELKKTEKTSIQAVAPVGDSTP